MQVVGNKIEVVNTGAFHGLHNLRELSLRANSIHTVKEKAFTGSIFISIYLFIFEKKHRFNWGYLFNFYSSFSFKRTSLI